MKKLSVIALSLVLAAGLLTGMAPAEADETTNHEQAQINLTDAQKQELAVLYKDIFLKRKEIIAKYVEFGILTAEKAKIINEHMDKQYKLLENNNFIPQWDMHKKHGRHHQ